MHQPHHTSVSYILLLTMLIQGVLQAVLPSPAIAGKLEQMQQALAQQERHDAEQLLTGHYTPQIEQMFTEYNEAVPVDASNKTTLSAINSYLSKFNTLTTLEDQLRISEDYIYGSTILTPQEQLDVFFKALGQYIGRHINQSRQAPSFRHNPNYRESASPTEMSSTSPPYNEDQVIHALNFLSIVGMKISQRERTVKSDKLEFHRKVRLPPIVISFSISAGGIGALLSILVVNSVFDGIFYSTPAQLALAALPGFVLGAGYILKRAYGMETGTTYTPAYSQDRGSKALIQGLLSGLGVTNKKLQKQFLSALQNQNIEPIRAALCEGALTPKSSVPRVRVALQPAPVEAQQLEEDYDEATSAQQSRQRTID